MCFVQRQTTYPRSTRTTNPTLFNSRYSIMANVLYMYTTRPNLISEKKPSLQRQVFLFEEKLSIKHHKIHSKEIILERRTIFFHFKIIVFNITFWQIISDLSFAWQYILRPSQIVQNSVTVVCSDRGIKSSVPLSAWLCGLCDAVDIAPCQSAQFYQWESYGFEPPLIYFSPSLYTGCISGGNIIQIGNLVSLAPKNLFPYSHWMNMLRCFLAARILIASEDRPVCKHV